MKDPTQAHENLEIAKNVPIPQARFGHTITMVNRYKVVLFGGATGDTGKYSMTGETFIFNMFLKTWTELNGKLNVFLTKIQSRAFLLLPELLMPRLMLSLCKWLFMEVLLVAVAWPPMTFTCST